MTDETLIDIRVPDIGDFEDVPVIEVLVADGEQVEAEQALLVLESDKSTMEVPAPVAGRVVALRLKVGDRVRQGDPICALETAAEDDAADADAGAGDNINTDAAKGAVGDSAGGRGAGNGDADGEARDASPASAPARASASASVAEAATASAPADAATTAGESASPARAAEPIEVTVPDIGDFEGVPVIEVLVADGDEVEAEQALLVLESDKSTMEVPAPAAGRIEGLSLKVGASVSQGDAICRIVPAAASADAATAGAASGVAADADTDAATDTSARGDAGAATASHTAGDTGDTAGGPSTASAQAQGPRMQPVAKPGLLPHASPGVRRFARELGVDLSTVQGSGPKQRIVIEDVQRYVKSALGAAPPAAASGAALPAAPHVDFSRFGEIETRPLARIRKLSAQNLHRNWLLVPHVTQTDDADITELEAFRREASSPEQKLTLLPFLIKAVGAALRAYPEFNSSLSADGDSLILKKYCHIGFAADTEQGLLVPVVRDVWNKGVAEIARDCAELAEKARDGKLKPDDMRGGCFSISSLGGIGGSHFTPIVNLPEVAILGVSRAQMKPVWNGKKFKPRLMCPLSLSYDHRVIDGAAAARFIVHLGGLLADVRRLLL